MPASRSERVEAGAIATTAIYAQVRVEGVRFRLRLEGEVPWGRSR